MLEDGDDKMETADENDRDEKVEEPLLGVTKSSTITPSKRKPSGTMDKINEPQKPSSNPDIAGTVMGNWGRWQLRTVAIIYLTKIPAAWFMACVIFTAPEPWYGQYKCDLSSYNNSKWMNVSIPEKITPDGTYKLDQCHVVLETNDTKFQVQHCNAATYSIDKYTTVVTQYDLVCSRNILVAISQSFHLLGVLIGGVIATKMMERWSPKTVMMTGMVLLLPCGISTGYAPWVWLHMILRTASAACCAMSFTPGAVIMADTVGGKAKTIVNANFEQFWSIGVILLPAIGYYTNTWGQIYITITLPTILIMFLWIWIPDSPRWHLTKDNIKKAQNILEEAAKFNKIEESLPDNLHELLLEQSKAGHVSDQKLSPNDNWQHLSKIPGGVMKVIFVMTSWSLLFTCYYGTLLNIRAYGREYLYATTAIAGLFELIGGFIGFQMILRNKNKWKTVGLFTILTGLVPCAVWRLPEHADGTHLLLDLMFISMFHKMGISACICVNTTCTAELFPLPHKKRVVFWTTVVTRIIFLSAPLIGATVKYGQNVPITFYGLLTVIAGITTYATGATKSLTSNLPTMIEPKIWSTNIDIVTKL